MTLSYLLWTRARGTTTSREHLINIFMSVFLRLYKKTSSKSKSSVLTDCSELDSEIILSECRIVGTLEGTRLELGVSHILTGTIQQFRTSRTTGPGLLNAASPLKHGQTHLNLGHHCHTQETRAVTPFV